VSKLSDGAKMLVSAEIFELKLERHYYWWLMFFTLKFLLLAFKFGMQVCRTGKLPTLGAKYGVSACSSRIHSHLCDMLFKERVATSGLDEDKTTAASRREFWPVCQLSDQLAVGFSCLSTASKINYHQ
jgi:hypothetical protein